MINFRCKNFTIQEGHYTGPKDVEKVPGLLSSMTKSALIGTAAGAVIGKLLPEKNSLGTAIQGTKTGLIAGIFYKILMNHIHKPMSSIKYSKVDALIRREFGIYQVAGVTLGDDSLDNRSKIDDRFCFNGKDVTNFKINVVIQNNEVVLYTFGIDDKELEKLNDSLDYYCKKYSGMNYNSSLINRKINSYSINIVFTNHQVICNFLMEVSKSLNCRINLLNNDSVISNEVKFRPISEEERIFSTKLFNKYDLMKILSNGGVLALTSSLFGGGWGSVASSAVLGMIAASLSKLSSDEIARLNGNSKRMDFGNRYLESSLKRLHYIEGFNYTVGDSKAEVNMSLISGAFIVTIDKKSSSLRDFEDKVYKKFKSVLKRSDVGNVSVFTYLIRSKEEFDAILKCLMSIKANPNLFEK